MLLKELMDIYKAINDILENSSSFKLNMQLLENQDLIEPYRERLSKLIGENPLYSEYEQLRLHLYNTYCDKTSGGSPIIINQLYIGLDNNLEFTTELNKLKAKYTETIKEMEPKIEEYNNTLNTLDVNLTFVPITEEIPDNIMNGTTQKLLRPLFIKVSNEDK